jgi:hypothetical protein
VFYAVALQTLGYSSMGAELPPEKGKYGKKLHVLLAGSCMFSLEIDREAFPGAQEVLLGCRQRK